MKMAMVARNVDTVVARLRQIGDRVVKGAREEMMQAAIRVEAEAKINAPRDEFRLEEAIHIEKGYGGHGGRLQLDVVVSGVIAGVDVERYAVIMHEHYEDIINETGFYVTESGRQIELRQGSREKQAAHPDHYIGGKFLERAAEKERKTLARYLTSVVTQAIGKGI